MSRAAVVTRVHKYRRGARIAFNAVVERVYPMDCGAQFRIEVVGNHVIHRSGFKQTLRYLRQLVADEYRGLCGLGFFQRLGDASVRARNIVYG